MIEHAVLDDAVLDDAVLDDAVLDDAVLDDAVLDDAVLDDAVLDDAALEAPMPRTPPTPHEPRASRQGRYPRVVGRYSPIDRAAPQVWTVPGWMSPPECDATIERAEQLGFETASIACRDGARVNLDARNNAHVTFDDEALAASMFTRARPHLPSLDGATPDALNPRWRVYRYAPGEHFATHRDGFVRREDGAVSRVTLMVYLCDVIAGGETTFVSEKRVVAPRAGTAVFFQHALIHESRPVLAGQKYVLRTDVFYAR